MSRTGRVPVLTGVLVLSHRDLRQHVRNRGMLLSDVAQVAVMLLVFGVAFHGMVSDVAGIPLAAFVFPGIATMNVAMAALSNAVSLAWDKNIGFAQEILVAPLPRGVLPIAKIVSSATIAVVHMVVMIPVGLLVGARMSAPALAAVLAAAALVALAFAALGVLLAVAVDHPEAVQGMTGVLMTPLFLLSGSVYRTDELPSWLSAAIIGNPMSHAVDLLRRAALGAGVPAASGVLTNLAVLGGVLAVCTAWSLHRQSRL